MSLNKKNRLEDDQGKGFKVESEEDYLTSPPFLCDLGPK